MMVQIKPFEYYIFKYDRKKIKRDLDDDDVIDVLIESFDIWYSRKHRKHLIAKFKRIMNSSMFTVNLNYFNHDGVIVVNVFSKQAATLLRLRHPEIEMKISKIVLYPNNDETILLLGGSLFSIICSLVILAGYARPW